MTETADLTKIFPARRIRNSRRIQVVSDIHLETTCSGPWHSNFKVYPRSPCLALLGNISRVHKGLFEFLVRQLQQFDVVFYVLGSHETHGIGDQPTGCSYETAVEKLQSFERWLMALRRFDDEKGTSNAPSGTFHFLNRTRVDLPHSRATVLGCTLFSHIPDVQVDGGSLSVSDFPNIESGAIRKHNQAHARDVAWLNAQVAHVGKNEHNRQIVILTHNSPVTSRLASGPEDLGDDPCVRRPSTTDLRRELCWTSPAVSGWAFGYPDYNCGFRDSTTGGTVGVIKKGPIQGDIFDIDAENGIDIGGGVDPNAPGETGEDYKAVLRCSCD